MVKKRTSTEELADYLKFMEEKNLLELEIKEGDSHIKLVRQSKSVPLESSPNALSLPSKTKKDDKVVPEIDGIPIKSPLAGVFYRARSPQSPPFINVGDTVTTDQPLCIIEAMKVMNEIVATQSGRLTKILVENGKPVEAGQILFILKQE